MSYRQKTPYVDIFLLFAIFVLKRPSGHALEIQVSINRNESRFQIVSLPYGKT